MNDKLKQLVETKRDTAIKERDMALNDYYARFRAGKVVAFDEVLGFLATEEKERALSSIDASVAKLERVVLGRPISASPVTLTKSEKGTTK